MVRVPLCRNEDEVLLPWVSFGNESTVPPPSAPVVAVHEKAGDPVRRRRLGQSGLVFLAVVDVRQLDRRSVLAPRDGGVAVEHQGRMGVARPDQLLLPPPGEL